MIYVTFCLLSHAGADPITWVREKLFNHPFLHCKLSNTINDNINQTDWQTEADILLSHAIPLLSLTIHDNQNLSSSQETSQCRAFPRIWDLDWRIKEDLCKTLTKFFHSLPLCAVLILTPKVTLLKISLLRVKKLLLFPFLDFLNSL